MLHGGSEGEGDRGHNIFMSNEVPDEKMLRKWLLLAVCFAFFKPAILAQKDVISILLKGDDESRNHESYCIKSKPLQGSPFTTFENALLQNLMYSFPSYFMYESASESWTCQRPIEKIEMDYTLSNTGIDLKVDTAKFWLGSYYRTNRFGEADSCITYAISQCDQIVSEYEFLISYSPTDGTDTALLRKVYSVLTAESTVPKFAANYQPAKRLSEDDLYREIDTSMYYDCSANVDVVAVDTNYFEYKDLKLTYNLIVGYSSQEDCFMVSTKQLGLARDCIDQETGVVKYKKVLGCVNREDLIKTY